MIFNERVKRKKKKNKKGRHLPGSSFPASPCAGTLPRLQQTRGCRCGRAPGLASLSAAPAPPAPPASRVRSDSPLPSPPAQPGAALAGRDRPGTAAHGAARASPPLPPRRDTENYIHPAELLHPPPPNLPVRNQQLWPLQNLNQLASILNRKYWFVYYPFTPSSIINENIPICTCCIFITLQFDITSNCTAVWKFKSLFGSRDFYWVINGLPCISHGSVSITN